MTMNSDTLHKILAKIFPTKADDNETRLFKRTVFTILGMIGIMAFSGIAFFFIGLTGREETMVPDLIGLEVVNAVEELNRKDLYPTIITQYTGNPKERNTVISQDPPPGLLAKAGRRITLRVSLGSQVDKVEDYRNQKLTDVRISLRKLVSNQSIPILEVDEEKLQYQYSDSPEGTVLAQNPSPGTEISAPTKLKFVISQGPRGQQLEVGSYQGKSYIDVMNLLDAANMAYTFSARSATGNETPGTVVLQDPVAGSKINKESVLRLTMAAIKNLDENELFGVFETTLPAYPIFVDLTLEARSLSGDSRVLAAFKHPGGPLGIPYRVKKGDTLILKLYGKELQTIFAQ